MKKLVILPLLALLLTGCNTKPSEPISSDTSSTDTQITTSEDTNTDTTPSSDIPSISIGSQGNVSNWGDVLPYLEFALGDYARLVPSYTSRNYDVFFQQSEGITAVQINCNNIRSTTAVESYSSVLANNGFEVSEETPTMAYKLVSVVDALFLTYLQSDTTFSIVAYYVPVRDTNWPTQIVEELVGKDIPVCEADAYLYQYGENGRGYITVSIDCYSDNGLGVMDRYLKKLSRAGYEYTNQSGYYTAISPNGEIVISFDDYYGDGTCIEVAMYSLWPSYDYKITFGFELPKYGGDYTNWTSQYMTIGNTDYVAVYYDGVTADSVTTYGSQLTKLGFTFDQETYDYNGNIVYYLEGKTINGVYEPWVQLAYQSGTLVVAVPYTILEN